MSGLEHHANLVPWQMACARSGAVLRHIPVRDDGTLDEVAFERLLTPARQGSVDHPGLERARHRRPGSGLRGQGEAGRPGHRRRRRAGGGSWAGRRARARLRLLCFLGPQDVRAHRHRRSLRPLRSARRTAPVAGRRRHDRDRHAPVVDLRRLAVAAGGGHAQHQRRRGPGGCGALPRVARSRAHRTARGRPACVIWNRHWRSSPGFA